MSIIKIPSSNIFDVDVDNAIIVQNQFQRAEIFANRFKKLFGNVLENRVIVTYWKEEPSTDYGDVTFVGTIENTNDYISFLKPTYALGGYFTTPIYPSLNEPRGAWMKNAKIINLQRNALQEVTNFSIVRERNYLDLTKDANDYSRNYQKTIVESTKLKYIQDQDSFSYDIASDKVNSNNVIIIGSQFGYTSNGQTFSADSRLLSETITIEGEYYEPLSILKEHKVSLNTTKSVSLPTNELVQENNTINNSFLVDAVLQSVVEKYQNGKEVYEIKCSIADYYDTDGNLIISPNDSNFSATFEMHTIVEPYVFTSGGEVPLSTKADGTPKRFEIIGIDYSYSGVVWQKLIIQESK